MHGQPVTLDRLRDGEPGLSKNGVPGKYDFKIEELQAAVRILLFISEVPDVALLLMFNVWASTGSKTPPGRPAKGAVTINSSLCRR